MAGLRRQKQKADLVESSQALYQVGLRIDGLVAWRRALQFIFRHWSRFLPPRHAEVFVLQTLTYTVFREHPNTNSAT
jgi:hypothetical protein